MIPDWQKGALCFLILAANSFGTEVPTTRERVQAIVERSTKDPNALLELKGVPLDIIMPSLREIRTTGEVIVEDWMAYRNVGQEKEFLEREASVQPDPQYSRLTRRLTPCDASSRRDGAMALALAAVFPRSAAGVARFAAGTGRTGAFLARIAAILP